MALLSFTPFSWTGWSFEFCGSHNCYCEPFRDGYFVRQPFTAASNIGYLVVGALVLRDSLNRREHGPGRQGAAIAISPAWYGISLLLAGCFSFFSHASLTRVGEWLDLMGVYLLESTLLALNLNRLGAGPRWVNGVTAVLLAAGGAQMAFAPQWQVIVIGALLLGVAGTEIAARIRGAAHGSNRSLLLGVGLYAVGAGVWALSGQQGGCLGSGFPGHTLWHLLSAAALGVLYSYYFSRERDQRRAA